MHNLQAMFNSSMLEMSLL